MAKNVHIEQINKIRLPDVVSLEDRGLRFCKTPIRAVATLDSVDLDKNSRLGLAYKFQSVTIELIRKRDGAVIPAPGITVNFPNQPDAVGFVIDWRQLTRVGPSGVELDQGCYDVKVNWVSQGGKTGFFYECSIELLEYNVLNTEGYVNMFVVLNDLVKHQGINYKDSGFATTLMFQGQFGYMQPNYVTTNNTYESDDTRRKIRINSVKTYELRTNQLLSCVTQKLDEEYLLAANQIYITDWNANNHVRDRYTNFPVIISDEESPVFEYGTSIYAEMKVIFKDKQQLYESKYNGDIKGSTNIILELPTLIGAPATSSVGCQLIKTGQKFSYRTGDDGGEQRGRDLDFFRIESNNPYGNNRRLTGITGGYHDGVQYVDVNGSPTSKALAFPDSIVLDWSTLSANDTLLAYYFGDITSRTWDASIDWAVALNLDGKNNWTVMNAREAVNVIWWGSTDFSLNYPPFDNAVSTSLWTSTTNGFTTVNAQILVQNRQSLETFSKAQPFRTMAVRYYSLTELGL